MSDRDSRSAPATGQESGRSLVDADDRLLAFADRLRHSDQEEELYEEKSETWVAFRLATSSYALPVTHVEEFAQIGKITRVPGAPSSVSGVASLRGHAIPIVDLKEHLGLSAGNDPGHERVLVIDHHGRRIGLIVDRVDRVFKLLPSLIRSVPPSEDKETSERILGFYENDGMSLVLLDADTFLGRFGETADRDRN